MTLMLIQVDREDMTTAYVRMDLCHLKMAYTEYTLAQDPRTEQNGDNRS